MYSYHCYRTLKILTTLIKLIFFLKITHNIQVQLIILHNVKPGTKNLKVSDEGFVQPKL